MQARKVEFGNYEIELDGVIRDPQTGEFSYDTVMRPVDGFIWIKHRMYSVGAGHNGTELMAAAEVVAKFRAAKKEGEDFVLLDTADWEMLKNIVNKLHGSGEEDLKMTRRVLEAPLIEMSPTEE